MSHNIIDDAKLVGSFVGLNQEAFDALERLTKYSNALEVQVGLLTDFIDELQDAEFNQVFAETFDGQVNALRESLIAAEINVEHNYALLDESVERDVDMSQEPEMLDARHLMAGKGEGETDTYPEGTFFQEK